MCIQVSEPGSSSVAAKCANHYIKPHPKLLIALFCEYDSTHKAQLVNLVFANQLIFCLLCYFISKHYGQKLCFLSNNKLGSFVGRVFHSCVLQQGQILSFKLFGGLIFELQWHLVQLERRSQQKNFHSFQNIYDLRLTERGGFLKQLVSK